MEATANDVLRFWFEELQPAQWWKKDAELDRQIDRRFTSLHARAVAAELWAWRKSPAGALAEVITIDQFSRNIYRDRPQAFAYDGMALLLAQNAVARSWDQQLPIERRAFLYLPYMHSESPVVHQEAVRLFSQPGLESNLDFEHKHKAIIDRFGRYPHRNAILGRDSTAQEVAFLKEPGSSF